METSYSSDNFRHLESFDDQMASPNTADLGDFGDLDKEIQKMQNAFYNETGGKNVFFKKAQKYECASHLSSKIPMQTLLERMCSILPNTDCVYISYPIFKTFAHPDNFAEIVNFILAHLDLINNKYGKIDAILDLDGFTVSAAGRYTQFIQLFCNSCFYKNAGYIKALNKFTVYNCPSVIDTIQKMIMPFIDNLPTSNVDIILKTDTKKYAERIAPYFVAK